MARYGMLINTKKCVGCYACRLACQAKNHLEPGRGVHQAIHELETGTYPNVYNEIVPTQCQHCEDAPCAAVCPTHATYVTDSGVVLVDPEKCIGCKYCMAACPYRRPHRAGVDRRGGEVPLLLGRRRAGQPARLRGDLHIRARACSATSTTPKATSRRLSRSTNAQPHRGRPDRFQDLLREVMKPWFGDL